jgi:hypothetical protein
MVNKKKDPESARKKAAGRAYTEEVNADAKPWLTKYLADKELSNNILPILAPTPKITSRSLSKPEKDYKALYESALIRIEELEKRLRKRIAKKDSKTPAGFGRGPKSVVPGGQPANATRKPKKHFSRQTNPYKD